MTFPFCRHPSLRPGDIAVALQLVLTPGVQYELLASFAQLSLGHSHNAMKRLALARLADRHTLTVSRDALVDFLIHGAPRAFPPIRLPTTNGVPVAHSYLPPLRAPDPATAQLVWPWQGAATTGTGLMPLYAGAPRTRHFNRRLYHLLSLVDTLRAGDLGHRGPAQELLASMITGPLALGLPEPRDRRSRRVAAGAY